MITAALLWQTNDSLEFVRGYAYTTGETISPASRWLDSQPEPRGSGEIALYQRADGALFTIRTYQASQQYNVPFKGFHSNTKETADLARYNGDRVIERLVSTASWESRLPGPRLETGRYEISGKANGTSFTGITSWRDLNGKPVSYEWNLMDRPTEKPYLSMLEALILFKQDLNTPYWVLTGGISFEKGADRREAPGGLVSHSQTGPLRSHFDPKTRETISILGKYTELRGRQTGAFLGGFPIVFPNGTTGDPVLTMPNGAIGLAGFAPCTPRRSNWYPGLDYVREVELRPLTDGEATTLSERFTADWLE